MSETVVQARSIARFFCHRCNLEFEDVLRPEYLCPYCAGGFIEQLERAPASAGGSTEQTEGTPAPPNDFTDADMSNVNASEQVRQNSNNHSVLSDLAFLMSGGQVRRGRPESFLEQLVLTIGGGAAAASGAVTAGAPFVFVSAPGDYVFGGEGLDAVVTQMLGQLEHGGPPPLSRDQIAAIPAQPLTAEQRAAHPACSVCWDDFVQGETVSRLECEHIFHSGCIEPWLRLHATCPICRHSLQREEPPRTAAPPAFSVPSTTTATSTRPASSTTSTDGIPSQTLPARAGGTPWPWERTAHMSMSGELPRVVVRRLPLRLISGHQTQTWDSPESVSGSGSSNSSVTTGGVWAPTSRSTTNSSSSTSSSSLNSDRDRQYHMDIDYD